MKLEAFLKLAGMKQGEFAKKAGVPASTISRVLRGKRRPGIEVISKIVDASQGAIRADDFLPGTHQEPAQ